LEKDQKLNKEEQMNNNLDSKTTNFNTPGKELHAEMTKTDIDKELQKLLESHKTVIKVFGTGGAGNNTVSRLKEMNLDNVETFAINTDAQDLLFAQADNKTLIGREITNGLGAGSDPKIGEDSAREDQDEMKNLVSKTDLVFVTCGLGGGTGTGSAPVIAELARESGALTISIVTLPFSEEGVLRWNNAQFGLEKLRKNSDTLIVIQNDKLWEIAPEIPLDDAFKVADEILVNAVKGITELVTKKGLVNLDFADIRTIMKDGGTALIGMAESDSPDRSVEAVESAIENPLIDLDINGAKNALLNITGGKDMTIKDAKAAMQTLAKKLDKTAKIIWGAHINPELDKKIRVMVIATGLRDYITDKLFHASKLEIERFSGSQKSSQEETTAPELVEVGKENVMEAKRSNGDQKEDTKKVFREIMEEEADADLKIFQDTLEELYKSVKEKKSWEELQSTCSTLTGTAQMFDFHDIAELMTSLEELITNLIKKEFFETEVLDVIKVVPEKITLMIQNDQKANEWAESFEEGILDVSELMKDELEISSDLIKEKLSILLPNNYSVVQEINADSKSKDDETAPIVKNDKDTNPISEDKSKLDNTPIQQ